LTPARIKTGKIAVAVNDFFKGDQVAVCLELLRSRLPAHAGIYVAGGAIRNLIIDCLHGHAPATSDIDVFIDGLSADFRLEQALWGQRTEQTELGGIRWYAAPSQYVWDLWLLPNFIIIKSFNLDPSIPVLLENIDFNVNAVIYDPFGQCLQERGCLRAIRRKALDFNTLRIADKAMIAYRILLIRHKVDFTLSERMFAFLKNRLELDALIHLRGLLIYKRGKAEGKEILKEFNRVITCPDYAAYLKRRTKIMGPPIGTEP